MEKLVDKGLTKSISVSNFNKTLLASLLEHCRIPPLTNQMEIHPHLQEKALLDYCMSKNIQLVAYCPLVCINLYPQINSLFSSVKK